MKKITCCIVDDEPQAIILLKTYLQEFENLDLIGECSSAIEVTNFLRQNHVDLMFLDIQMPKFTGIELLKILKNPPAVILTTAHREYALEGYNLDIVDYLLKPITFDRFILAIERFYTRTKGGFKNQLNLISPQSNNLILLKSGATTQQINMLNVLYVESLKDYLLIHFENGKEVRFKYKIGQLESELIPCFVRVHKSFIVNTEKVTVFSYSEIWLSDICIPVGQKYKIALRTFLNR